MSISSQGGEQRRPSILAGGKAAGKKTPPGPKSADGATDATPGPKAGTAKTGPVKGGGPAKAGKPGGSRPGAGKPGAKSGGGARRPVAPVKVNQGRSWGPIALFTAVGLIAAGIIGWGAYAVYQNGRSWEDRADDISGITNYRETNPQTLTRNHKTGPIKYTVSPPVGGDHNPTWQRCQGDVYDAQIPSENALHSLEHGAVWVTYRPDLARDQVDKLAGKVRGKDYLLMSPYPGLDKAISLQAWGYQLKVDSVNDGRIDDFISALRQNASMEPGATCSGGNYTTGTGTTPRDLSSQQDPNAGVPPGQSGG